MDMKSEAIFESKSRFLINQSISLKIISFILICTLLVTYIGCSRTPEPRKSFEYYLESGDIPALRNIIESDQYAARQFVLNLLNQYCRAKAVLDSSNLEMLKSQLDILVNEYSLISHVHDISDRYSLYQGWIPESAKIKITTDSLLKRTHALKSDVLPEDYRNDLIYISQNYASINDSFDLLRTEYFMAESFIGERKYDSARIILDKLVGYAAGLDDPDMLGNCYYLLARVFSDYYSNILAAESCLINALAQFSRIDNHSRVAFVLMTRGYNHLIINHNRLAIEYLSKAESLAHVTNHPRNRAYCLSGMAEAYCNEGIFDSAEIYSRKAIDLRKKLYASGDIDLNQLAYSFSNLAHIYQSKRMYDTALGYYAQADSLCRLSEDTSALSLNEIRLAALFTNRMQYDTAAALFQSAFAKSRNKEEGIAALYGLALSNCYLGRDSLAAIYARECIKEFEEARDVLDLPELKMGALSDKIDIYNLPAILQLRRYKTTLNMDCLNNAWMNIDQSKAYALMQLIDRPNTGRDQGHEEEIVNTLSRLRRELWLGTARPAAVKDSLELMENELTDEKYRRHENKIPDHYRDLLSRPQIGDIIGSLGKNDAIIEYVLSPLGNYLIVLSRDSCFAEKIDISLDSLNEDITRHADAISSNPNYNRNSDYWSTGRRLYDALIPDRIFERLGIKNLIIVPSGNLCHLPFETLIDELNQFMVSEYNLSYMPSSRIRLALMNRNRAESGGQIRIACFGDPKLEKDESGDSPGVEGSNTPLYSLLYEQSITELPNAFEEIQKISAIFGADKVTAVTEANASETAFRNFEWQNYSILHLSTHGLTDFNNPDRSALLFAMGDDTNPFDDGLLMPPEIMRLDMPLDLVFLAACKTGSGRVIPGEGVISLARPFLVAGAKAVIVSLWNVDDSFAPDYVETYYSNLNIGMSKAEALKAAKLKYISGELYSHPYYWSPFIYIGLDE